MQSITTFLVSNKVAPKVVRFFGIPQEYGDSKIFCAISPTSKVYDVSLLSQIKVEEEEEEESTEVASEFDPISSFIPLVSDYFIPLDETGDASFCEVK